MKTTNPLKRSSSAPGGRRAQLLERAAECRTLAATAHTEDARRVLLELAEHYDGTARASRG